MSEKKPTTSENPVEESKGENTTPKVETSSKQPDNSEVLKELEELREFKAKTEAVEKEKAKKENVVVSDTFISRKENRGEQKNKSNMEKYGEEMFDKGIPLDMTEGKVRFCSLCQRHFTIDREKREVKYVYALLKPVLFNKFTLP